MTHPKTISEKSLSLLVCLLETGASNNERKLITKKGGINSGTRPRLWITRRLLREIKFRIKWILRRHQDYQVRDEPDLFLVSLLVPSSRSYLRNLCRRPTRQSPSVTLRHCRHGISSIPTYFVASVPFLSTLRAVLSSVDQVVHSRDAIPNSSFCIYLQERLESASMRL
jgi:hypothetical protein